MAGEGDARPDRLYRGVAPGAALVGVKVLDASGDGTMSDVIAGIDWVVANRAIYGIEAINLSLGGLDGSSCSDGTDQASSAVNAASALGLLVVVAAGNEGPGTCTISSPAAAAAALTVGAMGDFGPPGSCTQTANEGCGFFPAFFSSRGPTLDGRIKPDISAPGLVVTSAKANAGGTAYEPLSGTSQATPFVTGVGLLMLDQRPALTPAEIKSTIMATAVDWGRGGDNRTADTTGPDIDYGAGRLDAYAALAAVGAPLASPPQMPAHTHTDGSLSGTGAFVDVPIVVTSTTFPIAATLIQPTPLAPGATYPDFDLKLLNPSGAQVAVSETTTSATTRRQVRVRLSPAATGTYILRIISSDGSGQFFVDISGSTEPSAYVDGGEIGVATGDGVDGGAGVDLSSRRLERATASLSANNCGTFGAYTPVTSPDSAPSGTCARYRFAVSDNVGNRSAWVTAPIAKVDATPPTQPALSFGSFTAASATGATVFVRPGAAGGFTVTPSSTDPESGIEGFTLPSLGSGWTHSGGAYSFAADAVDPTEPVHVVARNHAGRSSSPAAFAVTHDGIPTSTSALCNGSPCPEHWFLSSSVIVTLSSTDAGSGVDRIVYTLDGSAPTLLNGIPYLGSVVVANGQTFGFRAYDRVGNEEPLQSFVVGVDTSPPTTPELVFGDFANAVAVGSTVFYRPGVAGGFSVTPSSLDTETGVTGYSWPELGAGWSRLSHTYTFAVDAVDPVEPLSVTAENGAGLVSAPAGFTVSADSDAPVTTDDAPAGWRAVPVTVAFAASDIGSGVTSTEYSLDGGASYQPGTSVTVSAAGVHQILYRSRDRVGNVEAAKTATVRIDLTPPSAPVLAFSGFTNAAATATTVYFRPGATGGFTLTPSSTDPESGVDGYTYPSLGAGWTRIGSDYTFATDAVDPTEPLDVIAQNGAGSNSSPTSFTATADASAPVTTDDAPAGWRAVPVTVAFAAGDVGSGVASTEYSLDGGASYQPGTSVTVSAAGVHQILYRSRDRVGNVEAAKTATVRIDLTPPSAPGLAFSAFTNAAATGTTVFYRPGATGGFTLTPSSTDPESGIAGYTYPSLGAGWTRTGSDYTFATNAVDPTEPLDVIAHNGVGLASDAAEFTVTADATAPVTTDDAPSGSRATPVTVSFSATDIGGSGVGGTEYSLDGGASYQAGTSVTVSTERTHEIRYRSLDRVGNVETPKTATVQIDLTAPALSAATVNASMLALTYGEPLGAATIPSSAFAVSRNGGVAVAPTGVSAVADGATTVTLSLGTPVANGDTVTVSYTPTGLESGARIADRAGNAAAALVARVVSNTTPAPLPASFVNEPLIVGLNEPTGITFTPDGRPLIIGRYGKVWVAQPGATSVDSTPLLSITAITAADERGLLGIALDPAFAANGHFYLFYTHSSGRNRVSRFTAVGNSAALGSELVIWENAAQSAIWHQGGDLAFGPDGMLYISVGDNLTPAAAQSLTSYQGKILRIARDGTIPSGNPFADGPGPQRDEIWALGLRNPFRFTFDSANGRMIIGDVGEGQREEVNVGSVGANYGWPTCEGTCGVSGMTNPAFSYAHNFRDASITGGFVYRGTQFPEEYRGSYFYGDYSQNWIRRLTFDASGNVSASLPFEPPTGAVDGPYGNIVDLAEAPDGSLYYVDIGPWGTPNSGQIRRIRNVNANMPPVAVAAATPQTGPAPLTVGFSSTGSGDPELGPITYLWEFGDGTSSTQPNPTHTYAAKGSYTVRLRVSDGVNESLANPLTITVGSAPSAVVLTPFVGTTFTAGQTISYTGQATDPEDGALTGSSLTWQIIFHHDSHQHPGPAGAVGALGSFIVPESGHPFTGNTGYEIVLTATDSDGLTSTSSVMIRPQKVDLQFATDPGGLVITLDGIPRTAPFTIDTLVGFQHNVDVQTPQVKDGDRYAFDQWSDGGTKAHIVTATTTPGLYTASFIPDAAPTGLVAAWGFDEGTGSILVDHSGLGNHGVLEGPGWTTEGKHGGALLFDGVDDLVTVADSDSLDLTRSFTLEAWVKVAQLGADWQTVVLKEQPGHLLYALYAGEPPNGPGAHANLGTDNDSDMHVTAGSPLSVDTWVHLAGTYDGTDLKLFVDGVETGSIPVAGTMAPSDSPVRLGGNAVWEEWFAGLMDDVRIYDRALTASEIQADMALGVG